MRLDTKKKIIRYGLIIGGGVLFLFLILFNGTYWGLNTPKTDIDTLSVLLSVLLPLLVGALSISISGYFRSFTKQDALNQVERQYRNGIISTEHYKKSLREIEMFELEKNKLKAQLEVEKQLHKEELLKEVEKTIKGVVENNESDRAEE